MVAVAWTRRVECAHNYSKETRAIGNRVCKLKISGEHLRTAAHTVLPYSINVVKNQRQRQSFNGARSLSTCRLFQHMYRRECPVPRTAAFLVSFVRTCLRLMSIRHDVSASCAGRVSKTSANLPKSSGCRRNQRRALVISIPLFRAPFRFSAKYVPVPPVHCLLRPSALAFRLSSTGRKSPPPRYILRHLHVLYDTVSHRSIHNVTLPRVR